MVSTQVYLSTFFAETLCMLFRHLYVIQVYLPTLLLFDYKCAVFVIIMT